MSAISISILIPGHLQISSPLPSLSPVAVPGHLILSSTFFRNTPLQSFLCALSYPFRKVYCSVLQISLLLFSIALLQWKTEFQFRELCCQHSSCFNMSICTRSMWLRFKYLYCEVWSKTLSERKHAVEPSLMKRGLTAAFSGPGWL